MRKLIKGLDGQADSKEPIKRSESEKVLSSSSRNLQLYETSKGLGEELRKFSSITPRNFDCGMLSPFMQRMTGTRVLIPEAGTDRLRTLQYLRPLMERNETHGKIEETLKEIRDLADYIPRPPRKVVKVEDYGRLRYLLGGDDCMIEHPTRRPESFLAYLDTFHGKDHQRNHLLSTHAS